MSEQNVLLTTKKKPMGILSKLFSDQKKEETFSVESQGLQFSATDYCEQGQRMLNEGKLMQAMEFFQAAIEADKYFEQAYLLLSEAYEKQGKLDKARATLYALLALEPNNEKALKKIEALKASNSTATHSSQIPSKRQSNLAGSDIGKPKQFSSNHTGKSTVFEGKPKDQFDYFIIFDNGNRLYFKCKGANLVVVAPTERNWDGFIQPHGILQIPERITYDGVEMMVSSIGEHAFSFCHKIRSVELPDSIEEISSFAFSFCDLLTTINLPNSIKSIGSYAFDHCVSLKEIILPDTITEIGNETFYDCRCLERITIPKSVKKIATSAFDGFGFSTRQCVLIMEGMPPQLIGSSFNWNTLSISIPKGLKDEYQMAQHWQLLKIVEER